MKLPRRRFLGALSFAGFMGLSRPAYALIATPGQAEGPFYPRRSDRTPDLDNDLVQIGDAAKPARGDILMFDGIVQDVEAKPLANARVEIWQCDANGRYIHRRDFSASRPRDPHFQGIGQTQSDAKGRFVFRTIKPVSYPGRTPHIHMKVHDPRSGAVLTTQIYIAGEPLNLRDGLYLRLSPAERDAVTIALKRRENGVWQGTAGIII